jgi:hypothetical protein
MPAGRGSHAGRIAQARSNPPPSPHRAALRVYVCFSNNFYGPRTF